MTSAQDAMLKITVCRSIYCLKSLLVFCSSTSNKIIINLL